MARKLISKNKLGKRKIRLQKREKRIPKCGCSMRIVILKEDWNRERKKNREENMKIDEVKVEDRYL